MENKTGEFATSFKNLIGRIGLGFSAIPKDPDEAKLKLMFYDSYAQILDDQKVAIEDSVSAYQALLTVTESHLDQVELRVKICDARVRVYEIEREFHSVKYYGDNYRMRIQNIKSYNAVVSAEANEKFGEMVDAARQLINSQAPLETKDKLQLLGLINRYELKFSKDEERNQAYLDLTTAMQNITLKLTQKAPHFSIDDK